MECVKTAARVWVKTVTVIVVIFTRLHLCSRAASIEGLVIVVRVRVFIFTFGVFVSAKLGFRPLPMHPEAAVVWPSLALVSCFHETIVVNVTIFPEQAVSEEKQRVGCSGNRGDRLVLVFS